MVLMKKRACLALLLVALAVPVDLLPTTNRSRDAPLAAEKQNNDGSGGQKEEDVADQALQFLRKFGYLENSGSGVENLYSGEAVTDAIKEMQKFGDIPQTGHLDNATVQLMHKRRCGVSDLTRKSDPKNNIAQPPRSATGRRQNSMRRSKRFIQGAEGWRKRTMTYFISNWSPKLSQEIVTMEMQRAFQVWAEYGNLKFIRVNSPDADIIVGFGRGPHGDGYPFDGEGLVLAHAFYPYEMSSFGGDIHFDDDERWKVKLTGPQDDGVDFFSVAVHELGHSLGLAHSPQKDSVMFPYFKGFNSNPARLAYDDVLAMYHIYVSKNLPSGDQTSSTTRPTATTTPSRPSTPRPTNRPATPLTTPKPTVPVTSTARSTTTRSPAGNKPPSFIPTYEGDFDTVASHKQKFGSSASIGGTMTVPSPPKVAEKKNETQEIAKNAICNGTFDEVSLLRGEIVIFKDSNLWRFSDKKIPIPGYPVPFNRLFWQLPDQVVKIDATYERQSDNVIVIFSGDRYWETDGNNLLRSSGSPLSYLGLPAEVKKVDAALVWGKNGKTYFFSDKHYWKVDDRTNRVETTGYPLKISERWRGIPSNIDSAFTYKDGATYFFKGKHYWKFDNEVIHTEQNYPKLSTRDWFGCS
ncbi:matrix metalloproteinase-2-like [Neocloeon triangulifer]|uniref:matrix metalloproteinase-2-like n=1 Tax=Neocloeon triangulifer TaxID=2078957 RepID=UPI00286F536A|nr:matrix metalloproteinase-2-like [Neocloeon triangulifer]